MLRILLLFLWVGLWGCAGAKPPTSEQMPSESGFSVPTDLAKQFSVQPQSASSQVPSPATVAPANKESLKHPTELSKNKTRGRRERAKTGVKAEKLMPTPAQIPNRWPMPPLFRENERHLFDITYFGATAGELEISILPQKTIADRKVFHFRAEARTAPVFALFYRMNDVAESFVDSTGLFTHKFSLKLDESLQQRDVLELYDFHGKKMHYWSKLDHKRKGKKDEQLVLDIEPFSQDALSAFFYLRTLPLETGKFYEFPVVTNAKNREVRVTVVRREVLKTRLGSFPSIVVQPKVVLDGILQTRADRESYVWLSDDERRIILKVDAKIKVGSIIAYLRDHSYGNESSKGQD
jgi:hypothetical protein